MGLSKSSFFIGGLFLPKNRRHNLYNKALSLSVSKKTDDTV